MAIEWKELFKVRLAKFEESMDKHDIIKILLVRKLLRKHRKHKNFIRIYTEFYITEGIKCDVYYENLKTKEAYSYEIQKDYSKEWLKDRAEKYKDWKPYLITTNDWIPINLNKLSDDIYKMSEQLEEYCF